MPSATVKLQTNIPITGTLDYCDYIKSTNPQYNDQIALKGTWDGSGQGRIYLPLALEGELSKKGIIGPKAENGNYPVLMRGAKVRILRVEDGKSKRTSIDLLDSAGPATVANTPAATPYKAASYGGAATKEQLEATLQECLEVSHEMWMAAGFTPADCTDAIAASAHTLFIARSQRGLFAVVTQEEEVPF